MVLITTNSDGSETILADPMSLTGGDLSHVILSSTDTVLVDVGSSEVLLTFSSGQSPPQIQGLLLKDGSVSRRALSYVSSTPTRVFDSSFDGFESAVLVVGTSVDFVRCQWVNNSDIGVTFSNSATSRIINSSFTNNERAISALYNAPIHLSADTFNTNTNPILIRDFSRAMVFDCVFAGVDIVLDRGGVAYWAIGNSPTTPSMGINNQFTGKGDIFQEEEPHPFQEFATVDAPLPGEARFYYDLTEKKPKYSDGVSWEDFGGLWADDGSGNVYRETGNVGVGVTNPLYPIHVSKALTSTGDRWFSFDDGADSGATFYIRESGLAGTGLPTIQMNSDGVQGLGGTFRMGPSSTGDINSIQDTYAAITLTAVKGAFGPLSNADILAVNNWSTNILKIDISGRMGIKTPNPAAMLHLPAGTTTTGTASLLIPEGSDPTSPADGEINHVSDRLHFTTGTTINTIAHLSDLTPLSGSGAPGVAPRWNGDRYFDYTNSKWYSSWDNEDGDGTGDGLDADDWIILN